MHAVCCFQDRIRGEEVCFCHDGVHTHNCSDGQLIKLDDGDADQHRQKNLNQQLFMGLGRPTRFSFKQLKKYTNNFNHKLGQGGFGSVFKGQLPNGFPIAVKLIDENEHSEVQFLNEVLTIGKIHHNHLVRLLGYSFEQSKQALVYEFMKNGSLFFFDKL
ncbi:hypothetical protein NE237_025995 [Protea cynaroides]|uniref:Protein kinase domain-containing protein n=1 Tax=Protea cynaroides TaxID=273540 RepID=A0A9Q0H832_9MAGN|nr:hypothetical protein NE237_025995 [Protea cynaroides]